ncbi:hypothetical protein CN136_19550 [Sinorhizobium meliloti]|nr:hypothetical protein CN136_19550 [Sinorhizobium meliloti]
MQRPFISKSFKELEEIFRKASREKDHEFLTLLDHELTFRQKNQKTPALRQDVARSLAKAAAPQADLFVVSAPAPAARSRAAGRATAKHTRPASRKKSKFKPTDEQDVALQAFLKGHSLRINAFAGSGKTSTLQFLANATGLRGQYLAFNKSIVADAAEKFPDTVDCSTSHSLAFRAAPSGYKRDIGKLTNRCTAKQLVEVLDIKRRKFGDNYAITPDSQGYLYLETIRRYAQSADNEIGPQHVPVLGAIKTAPEEVRDEVIGFALEGARHVWSRMLSEQDPLPLGHDGYLKLWGLSRPIIAADFIMLDEAQDTNPVVRDILQRQRAQLIYVGDRYQQIYEWRGRKRDGIHRHGGQHTPHDVVSLRQCNRGSSDPDAREAGRDAIGEGQPQYPEQDRQDQPFRGSCPDECDDDRGCDRSARRRPQAAPCRRQDRTHGHAARRPGPQERRAVHVSGVLRLQVVERGCRVRPNR